MNRKPFIRKVGRSWYAHLPAQGYGWERRACLTWYGAVTVVCNYHRQRLRPYVGTFLEERQRYYKRYVEHSTATNPTKQVMTYSQFLANIGPDYVPSYPKPWTAAS